MFQPLFNLAECNDGRYQPVVFTTHGNSECFLIKSKCSEEGQVLYSNGSSSVDITCRCDYTQGYAFVSKPKNSCFCLPSEEDCSCFRVNCSKLSPGEIFFLNQRLTNTYKHRRNYSLYSFLTSIFFTTNYKEIEIIITQLLS